MCDDRLRQVSYFKGIPFAASTAGANRFMPPQPTSWSGVFNASAFGPGCYQVPAPSFSPCQCDLWFIAFAFLVLLRACGVREYVSLCVCQLVCFSVSVEKFRICGSL